mmetsp:Transcript_16373/g.49269  ORF Transcript_16373/g.49269 Transcript_16373/m.49269 type:complete len:327 (+) Transcript_16373:134-1114(+)
MEADDVTALPDIRVVGQAHRVGRHPLGHHDVGPHGPQQDLVLLPGGVGLRGPDDHRRHLLRYQPAHGRPELPEVPVQLRVRDEADRGRLDLPGPGLVPGRHLPQLLQASSGGQRVLQGARHTVHTDLLALQVRQYGVCRQEVLPGVRDALVVRVQLPEEADHGHLEGLDARQALQQRRRREVPQLARGGRAQEPHGEAAPHILGLQAPGALDGELLDGPEHTSCEREAPVLALGGRRVALREVLGGHVALHPGDRAPRPRLLACLQLFPLVLLVGPLQLREHFLYVLLLLGDLLVPLALHLLLHLLGRGVGRLHLQQVLQRLQALL